MDLSIFVAQLAAIIYLSVGVGMLFDKKYYTKFLDGFMKDTTAMYLAGFSALVAGFAIVTYHNDWVKSWEVLITIIGWMAFIKGIMILAFPSVLLNMTKSWVNGKKLAVYAPIVIIFGLVFGYFGFVM